MSKILLIGIFVNGGETMAVSRQVSRKVFDSVANKADAIRIFFRSECNDTPDRILVVGGDMQVFMDITG